MQQINSTPYHSQAANDDSAVDKFSEAMKEKLAKSRAKGRYGWDDVFMCTNEHLAECLIAHLFKGNEGTFEDIANFAMMLHHRRADPKVLSNLATDMLGEDNESV